jgi:hypothetical protein
MRINEHEVEMKFVWQCRQKKKQGSRQKLEFKTAKYKPYAFIFGM